jgi:peptide/nickel transport system substrate-binding protein
MTPPRRMMGGLLALALAGLGCGRPTPDAAAASGVVRTFLGTDPASLSLIGKTDATSEMIAALLTDSLVKYTPRLGIEPRLAESWTTSPDGLTWTFTLRDGARWHDGTPVTARDVAFTVRAIRDPKTESRSYLPLFDTLLSAEAVDDRTFRAVYREARADALDAWTVPILPEHLAAREANLLESEFARRPVGCGPFRLVRAVPGQEIVLEANRDYWDGAPLIAGITFRILPDERTAFEALLRGDLDLMTVTPDLWREASSSPRAARLGRFVFGRLGVWYVGWNQDGSSPFFLDPRVRQAMVLALDRVRFAEQVLGGLAHPAAGTYYPGSPWADPSVTPRSYDPAAAAALLDAAGWIDTDADGVRDRGGVAFDFELLIPSSSQDIVDRQAAWIQDSLARVGVRTRIEKLEWRAFQERRRAHRFHAAMASLSLTPAPDQFEFFHSSARENGLNYVGFADPEVDRLLVEGRSTFDPGARTAIYARLQRRIHALEPVSCLFHFATPVLHDPRLAGVEPSPLGLWLAAPGPRRWRWTEPPGTP